MKAKKPNARKDTEIRRSLEGEATWRKAIGEGSLGGPKMFMMKMEIAQVHISANWEAMRKMMGYRQESEGVLGKEELCKGNAGRKEGGNVAGCSTRGGCMFGRQPPPSSLVFSPIVHEVPTCMA